MRLLRRAGFSLVELLVVVGIVGVLTALILPAIHAARAASRAAVCRSNLRQVGIAIHSHIDAFGAFPSDGRPRLDDPGHFRSFTASLLPFLEVESLDASINYAVVIGSEENRTSRAAAVSTYLCPSDHASSPSSGFSASSYAANAGRGVLWHGYDGIFVPFGSSPVVVPKNVSDGLANTCAVGEHLASDGSSSPTARALRHVVPAFLLPSDEEAYRTACRSAAPSPFALQVRGRHWQNPFAGSSWYNHFLTPNQPSCANQSLTHGAMTAGSLHGGTVHCLFADGSVRAASESIDLAVWRAMGSRAGGEPSASL